MAQADQKQTTRKSATGNKPMGNGRENDKSETSYDDLSKQIDQLKSDIANLAGTIADLGKSETQRLRREAEAAGGTLKARGEAQLESLEDTARGYVRDGERFMREQPGTALGIVAAIGFLFGFMMSRK